MQDATGQWGHRHSLGPQAVFLYPEETLPIAVCRCCLHQAQGAGSWRPRWCQALGQRVTAACLLPLQGDMVVHLAEAAREELERPARDISRPRLQSLLELAVRTSSLAQVRGQGCAWRQRPSAGGRAAWAWVKPEVWIEARARAWGQGGCAACHLCAGGAVGRPRGQPGPGPGPALPAGAGACRRHHQHDHSPLHGKCPACLAPPRSRWTCWVHTGPPVGPQAHLCSSRQAPGTAHPTPPPAVSCPCSRPRPQRVQGGSSWALAPVARTCRAGRCSWCHAPWHGP